MSKTEVKKTPEWKLYDLTWAELRAADSKNDHAGKASAYRKLMWQLEFNATHKGWDPHTCVLLMKECGKSLNTLVDGEKFLNNYAESSLTRSTRFTNHSQKWKSSVNFESDLIQNFVTQNISKSKAVPPKNTKLLNALRKPLGPLQLPNKKQDSIPPTKPAPSAFGGKASANNGTASNGGFRSTAAPSDYHTGVGGNFGPGGANAGRLARAASGPPPPSFNRPSPTSNFSFRAGGMGANGGKRFPSPVSSGPSLQPPRPSNSNQGVGAITSRVFNKDGGHNRAPRPISYPKANNNANVNARDGQNPQPSFRTAHDQLFIDQQNRNKGRNQGANSGEITQASYGGGKKCLGTRPGPMGGFKPPVRQQEDPRQGGGQGYANGGPPAYSGGGPSSSAGGYGSNGGGGGQGQYGGDPANGEHLMDERYKNIDPKMVELILNEIMDQGSPVDWNDIAGLEFAKETVKEIVVWPMLRPDIFTGLRGPPKGLLLFGPPGTGKTLIGKCIASQSGSTFFSISASSLTSKWVGEGEKMVRALFAVAKVHQPSVVFIDEIDSLLSSRSDSEHESSRRIKTEFLVQLDGASTVGDERVLVVGATNRPQELDEAARRRLVKRLYIPLPELEARRQIICNLLMKEKHQLTEDEIVTVSRKTDGYSGADMANLCKEAAMGPIRSLDFSQIASVSADEVRPIVLADLEAALRQVKASVSSQDLQLYLDWDKQFGAGK